MRRPFLLSVDSGAQTEPSNRYFGTLAAAREAMAEYPEHFRRFAWITEIRDGGDNIVHVKDGKEPAE